MPAEQAGTRSGAEHRLHVGWVGLEEQRLPASLLLFAEWRFTQSHSVDNV